MEADTILTIEYIVELVAKCVAGGFALGLFPVLFGLGIDGCIKILKKA